MRNTQRGTSMVEVTVAIAILAATLLMVQEVFATTQTAQLHIVARDRAAQQSSSLITELRSAGLSSRRIYQDDAQGRAYLAAVVTNDLPILADARLPVIDPTGRLEPDAEGARRTGNVLLLACEDRPRDIETSGARHRIDVVRFVAVYPTRRVGRVVQAIPDQIDLVQVTSRSYADRASLDRVTDPTELAEVLAALRAAGFTRAWVADATLDEAFFELLSDDTLAETPVAAPTIDTVPEHPASPMLGAAKSSVAPNDPALRVPEFARLDETLPEFPCGFEVKVVGLSGGRQVLVRLTLLSGTQSGPDATSTTSRIFSCRDP